MDRFIVISQICQAEFLQHFRKQNRKKKNYSKFRNIMKTFTLIYFKMKRENYKSLPCANP